MLPISDDNPTEITPFVTWLLIAANAAVWLLVQGAGSMPVLEQSVIGYGTRPCELTAACAVDGYGWETVVTSMFMHGSWEHIIGNMLFLWVFGNNIEDSMGHLRFIVFYLLCGVVAGLAHVYSDPGSAIPAVGASGAVSGVMGGYILLYPRARVRTWIPPFWFIPLPAFLVLAYWFAIQLFMGVATLGAEAGEEGGVAVWAHVGGFVAGLLLIHFFRKRRLVQAKRRHEQLPPDEVRRLEW
ncbi:MAG TPA: rhomboid family intramembrane serine protease [Longimicrobium sp.]|nr:rhomboid family intramembrane serine protease [Longimicrobium sp.]